MVTALWVMAATAVIAFAVWRLRRANHTLATILYEERERDAEPIGDTRPSTIGHDK
ncbi:MAG: hypothetical protein M3548_15830 [Actinomycetota bacterium]|nr:hypothetical protein [Actinomycetota bacterium]